MSIASSSRFRLSVLLGALFVTMVFFRLAVKQFETGYSCSQSYRLDSTISGLKEDVRAEVAESQEAKSQGLSGRSCIPAGVGMLFSFKQPGSYGFWMKDMAFPIDIVWLDSDRRVVTVVHNAPPDSYPKSFTSSVPAEYVLEIGAGEAKYLGVRIGSQLTF